MIAGYKPVSKTALALSLIIIAALGIATFTRASDQPTAPTTTRNTNDNNNNTSPETAVRMDAKRISKRQLDNSDQSNKKAESQVVDLRKVSNSAVNVVDAQSAPKLDQDNGRHMQSALVEARTRFLRDSGIYDNLAVPDRMKMDAKMRSGEKIGRLTSTTGGWRGIGSAEMCVGTWKNVRTYK